VGEVNIPQKLNTKGGAQICLDHHHQIRKERNVNVLVTREGLVPNGRGIHNFRLWLLNQQPTHCGLSDESVVHAHISHIKKRLKEMFVLLIAAALIMAIFLVKGMFRAFLIDFGVVPTYITTDGELNVEGRGTPVIID